MAHGRRVHLGPSGVRARPIRAAGATPRSSWGTPGRHARVRRASPGRRSAIVAACSISCTSGPVKVAPTITCERRSTTSWLVPAMSLPRVYAPATSPVPTRSTWTSTPASRACASVGPTAATCGSVNVTGSTPVIGDVSDVLAGDDVAHEPPLVLAHVREEREPVDVPHGVEPVAVHAAHAEADRPPRAGRRDPTLPTRAQRRRCSDDARRPRATHRRRPRAVVEREDDRLHRVRRAAVAVAPVMTVMPSDSNAASTSSPANGSSLLRSRGPPSITVTSREPSRRKACVSSAPIGSTTQDEETVPGISLTSVAARLSQARTSARPSIGGMNGEVPVASTTACFRLETAGPVHGLDLDDPGAREPSMASHQFDALVLEPGVCVPSLQSFVM